MNQPSPHPLEGCWRKLEWAKVHTESFQAEVASFFGDESDPDTPKGHLHSKSRGGLPDKQFAPSWYWPLRVGDIIHAFRSSLDYLAWELARLNLVDLGVTRPPKRTTAFPIVHDPANWPDVSTPRLKDISEAHRRLIEGFQPYHAEIPREEPLWVLSRLSNRDKHQTLNVLVVQAGGAVEEVEEDLAGWAFISSPYSERMIHESKSGEVKGEFKMKATYHIAVEDFGRIDWVLDWIGPKVAEIVRSFEPVFEDS